KSTEKRELILEGARKVFLQKGFAAANMKDITEECGISRGGLYFYFSSVEEIFTEVLKSRKRTAAEMFRSLTEAAESFPELLEEYFAYQKERLQNMDRSLLAATIEYGLCHREREADQAFLEELYAGTRAVICEVLDYGVRRGELPPERVGPLADHILFTIEGLNLKAMTARVPEPVLETQLNILKTMILEACSDNR
ncbi:TetR/AcrR family transcriptional regulator, partial [Ruminococcaceae bacterium OttesenSCG-928-D13]|nr:TetR/AcrR family transcriptional regulator [Ruminococcaceae bacterium OttesenSCG-928-D13]